MILKPTAIPAFIWFSLLLAIEGLALFGLLLAVDGEVLPSILLRWLNREILLLVELPLGFVLAAGVFAAIWVVHAALSTLWRAPRHDAASNVDADDPYPLKRAA